MQMVAAPRHTRASVRALDLADPLASMRDKFFLPRGIIYLDGNSLGALPRVTRRRLNEVIQEEWGERLIRSWNESGWIEAPQRVGDKIARLIGARPGEVIVADSTSINLFKTLAAALALRPERRVILSTVDNFPTDLYMAQGLIQQLGGRHELRLVQIDELEESLTEEVAALMVTHVNYQSGRILDMPRLTRKAHMSRARWRCGTWRIRRARCRWTWTPRMRTSRWAVATSISTVAPALRRFSMWRDDIRRRSASRSLAGWGMRSHSRLCPTMRLRRASRVTSAAHRRY